MIFDLMSQLWMLGIIVVMGLFGISAAIFRKKGKEKEKQEK